MDKFSAENEGMHEEEENTYHHQSPLTPPSKTGKTKKPSLQYRSNLRCVIQDTSTIKFKTAHIEKLEKYCPFWSLCNLVILKQITKETCRKSDLVVKKIIESFDRRKESFYLGGQYLKIKPQDIQQIFGISGGKEKIFLRQLEKHKSSLFQRRFIGSNQVQKKHVVVNLKAACAGTSQEDIDDVPKLMTLFLLSALFTPSKTSNICLGYINYVDDLKKIKDYDWSGHVFEKLNSSLIGSVDPENVTGCVLAIPYWVMNNFSISDPINEDAHLLCQKWDLRGMAKAIILKNLVDGSFGSKKRLSWAAKRKTSGMGQRRGTKRVNFQASDYTQSCKKIKKAVDNSSNRFKARTMESEKEKYQATKANGSASMDEASNTMNFIGSTSENELNSETSRAMEAPDHRVTTLVAHNTPHSSPSAYPAMENDSATKDKAAGLSILNSTDQSSEYETGSANELNTVNKVPSLAISNTNGCPNENKTGSLNEKNVVDGSRTTLNLDSSTRRIQIEKRPMFAKSNAQNEYVPQSFSFDNVEANNELAVAKSDHLPNPNSRDEEIAKSSQVVSNFESFKIIVDGTDITADIPKHTRISYFDLCRTRDKLLHVSLTKGIYPSHAVSVICETVTISNAIKACTRSTPRDVIAYWGIALDSYWAVGMGVGFMRARVNRLLDLKTNAIRTLDQKREEEAKAEGGALMEKIRGYELEIEEMRKKIGCCELEVEEMRLKKRKIDDERQFVRKKAENFETILELEASDSW